MAFRASKMAKEGYSGHIGVDISRKYLLSHGPTDLPPEGVEGKTEIKLDYNDSANVA